MQIAVFSAKQYDQDYLGPALQKAGLEPVFFEARLCSQTASIANGFRVVCVFVNDELDAATLGTLAESGCELVALRCAGFNNVDIKRADELNIRVVRVPEYSPQAVAEHTFALILALNRRTHKAHQRVREGNFALDGLLGFDIFKTTFGIIGTGKIGQCVAQIAGGFGCRVLLSDPKPNPEAGKFGDYTSLESLLESSDIISLHCPLNEGTHHMINGDSISRMKHGAMLINTSRGGLVDTKAVIQGLKSQQIGFLGLDVYEEEKELFFEDRSQSILQDDTFARLLTFRNVLITSHQAFFTSDALQEIAHTTASSIRAWQDGEIPKQVICGS